MVFFSVSSSYSSSPFFLVVVFFSPSLPLFLGNFQEGSTEIETEKKKKKTSIHNFFVDNPDQDIEI
jgi:hypothetical protein